MARIGQIVFENKGLQPLVLGIAAITTCLTNTYAMDSLKVKEKTQSSIGTNLVNDAVIFAKDAGAYFTLPLHMSGKAWLVTGGILGGLGLSMAADKSVKSQISVTTRKTYNRDILDVPTLYGFVQYPSAAAAVLYTIGLFGRDNEVRTVARLWMEGLAFGGTTVMGLRYLLGRYRPSYSDDPWKYTWFQTKGDTQAMPSGHTVVAFTTSAVFAEYIDSW